MADQVHVELNILTPEGSLSPVNPSSALSTLSDQLHAAVSEVFRSAGIADGEVSVKATMVKSPIPYDTHHASGKSFEKRLNERYTLMANFDVFSLPV